MTATTGLAAVMSHAELADVPESRDHALDPDGNVRAVLAQLLVGAVAWGADQIGAGFPLGCTASQVPPKPSTLWHRTSYLPSSA